MRRIAPVVAVAAGMLLAACSGGGASLSANEADGDSTQGSSGGKESDYVSVSVGVIPVAEFTTLYLADEEGLFADEGLDVDLQVMSNAASIVPSVLNGQLTFGTSATPPFLVAIENGMPLKAIVNSGNTASSAGADTGALLVKEDSDIRELADLEGKTVAVNALSSLPHVANAAGVKQAGGDPSRVNYVAMPFPDMQAALAQGRVDALLAVEPFMTQNLSAGGVRTVAPLYADVYPAGTTHTLMFASEEYASENPEVVASFQRAMARANELVQEDPQLLRDALVEFGGMSPEVAQAVKLPAYETAFDVEGMQAMADLMVDTGFLAEPVDVSGLVVDQRG